MLEIERKFLVVSTDWGTARTVRPIEQGYLFISKERNMRIRRSADSYSLTLKVAATELARHEVERDRPVKPLWRIVWVVSYAALAA